MSSKLLVSEPINARLSGLPQLEEPTALLRALDSQEINEAERLEAVKRMNIHKEELRSEGGQLASVAQDLPKAQGDLRKSLAEEVAAPSCVEGMRKWWYKKMNKKKEAKLRLARLEKDSAELDRAREQLLIAAAKHTDLEEAHRNLYKLVSFTKKNVVTVNKEIVQKSKSAQLPSTNAHLEMVIKSKSEEAAILKGHQEQAQFNQTVAMPTVTSPPHVKECAAPAFVEVKTKWWYKKMNKKKEAKLRLARLEKDSAELDRAREQLLTAAAKHTDLEEAHRNLYKLVSFTKKNMVTVNKELVQKSKSWSAHLPSSDSLFEMVIPNSGHPEMVRIQSTPIMVDPSFVMDYEMTLQLMLVRAEKKREELLAHHQAMDEREGLLAKERFIQRSEVRLAFLASMRLSAYKAELLEWTSEWTSEQLSNEAQDSRKEMDKPNEEIVLKSKSWSAHLASSDSILEIVRRIKSTPTVVNPSFVMDYEMTFLLERQRMFDEITAFRRAMVDWERKKRLVFLAFTRWPHSANKAELLEKTSEELNNEVQDSRKEMDQPNEEIVQKSWSAHLASNDSLLEIVRRIKSTPTVVNPSFVMDDKMTSELMLQLYRKTVDKVEAFLSSLRQPHSANKAELLEKTGEQLNNEAQDSRKEPNEEIVQKSWSAHLASNDSLLEIVRRIQSTPTVVNPSFVMDDRMTSKLKLVRHLKDFEELQALKRTLQVLMELLAHERAIKKREEVLARLSSMQQPHSANKAELLEWTSRVDQRGTQQRGPGLQEGDGQAE